MSFSTKNIILIIIILIFLVLIGIYIVNRNSIPEYKGRGYCPIENEYQEPQLFTNFINEEESKHILKISEPLFSESKLVTGGTDNVRKSETAWLSKDDPVINSIIQKVCNITKIPFENAEKMQVVKYDPNGFYNAHYDASCDDKKECVEFEQNGGQRKVTMIIYLNDDFTGGATHFPNLNKTFIPKKYNALLFYSLEKNGNKCHPLSLHAGMPVETGQKYIANVWLREKEYHSL
tara:strand:- start:360 stop:1061 length:702 start_codon:yes stop_codon:yes gene_type:complete